MSVPRLTPEQAAIVGAYTGILLGELDELYAYIRKLLGRDFMTQELGSDKLWAVIKERAEADYLAIAPISEETRERLQEGQK